MRVPKSSWAISAILLVALLLTAGACLLPDQPYQRWQLLVGTIHDNSRWIYERTHFDPTPVDVVFVGPSRMEMGVNAPRLERDLAALGAPAHVVNAALPQDGRNLADVIVREILSAKHPRLLVVGVAEKPSRFGHPAFRYLASARQVIDPGYPTDFNYLADLIYLPYRQIRLFAASLTPDGGGLARRFDSSRYAGTSLRTTGSRWLGDGKFQDADRPGDPSVVAAAAARFKASMHPPLFGGRIAGFEFGDERANLRDIAALAHSHGVKVVFLYLPYYGAEPKLVEQDFYDRLGPVWKPSFLATRLDLYYDYGHLDGPGADLLTDWLAPQVAAQLRVSSGKSPQAAPRPA